MNYILLQPDNFFAICTPDKKELIIADAGRESVIHEFVSSAVSAIHKEANRIIDALLSGENPYNEKINFMDVLVSQYFNDPEPFKKIISEYEKNHPILWKQAIIKYYLNLTLFPNGTSVKTRKTFIEGGWTESALLKRKFDITGKIVGYHDGHGLCYDVLHDEDSVIGCYDPWELEII